MLWGDYRSFLKFKLDAIAYLFEIFMQSKALKIYLPNLYPVFEPQLHLCRYHARCPAQLSLSSFIQFQMSLTFVLFQISTLGTRSLSLMPSMARSMVLCITQFRMLKRRIFQVLWSFSGVKSAKRQSKLHFSWHSVFFPKDRIVPR